MSKFTPETIERVRESADIVEVVSQYTDLRRQGERFVGLCPFHDERTPSFSVKPAQGFYYCFGCEAGGDTIRFVQEKEGLSFPDAVEALADRYGVEIEVEKEDPKAEEARRRRGRLGELLNRVAAFYEAYLWREPKAAKAREYLTGERGLDEETLRNFGVGFAPSAWDSVLTRGQQAGFTVDELLAAGLIQRSQKTPGSHYDRFRGRITFPVRDHRGRVVGFGARGMGPDAKPKYLNSPEGEMYRKGRTLYGIDRARGPIARGSRAVVVEGYTDVIALHQDGVEEAVAVMGTAITPDQLKMLGGYAEEVVLALDADRAGREAMLRAQRVAGSGRLRLLVAAMPEGEDPADMLLTPEGGERLRAALADAEELGVFHVRAILRDADLKSPSGRDKALRELAPIFNSIEESIASQAMFQLVFDQLDAPPEFIQQQIREMSRPAPSTDSRAEPAEARVPVRRRKATPQEEREYRMLALALSSPQRGSEFLGRLTPEHFGAPRLRQCFGWLREHLDAPLEGLDDSDPALYNTIVRLQAVDHEAPEQQNFEFRWALLERDRLQRELREAEQADDFPAKVRLGRALGELNDVIARGTTSSVSDKAR